MTKLEYCELQGLHTSIPFDPNEEADEDFMQLIDKLTACYMKIYEWERDNKMK